MHQYCLRRPLSFVSLMELIRWSCYCEFRIVLDIFLISSSLLLLILYRTILFILFIYFFVQTFEIRA